MTFYLMWIGLAALILCVAGILGGIGRKPAGRHAQHRHAHAVSNIQPRNAR